MSSPCVIAPTSRALSFPAKTKVLHVGFDDPPRLAEGSRTEEEAMAHYRRVRDEIKRFVERLPEALMEEKQDKKEK